MTIYFYDIHKPYGCFTNFSRHPLELDGLLWPTSEHYFQAQKYPGTSHAEEIRLASTPREAFQMGKQRHWQVRADWDQVKDDVMRKAVLQKFRTHADIRAILLSTGDDLLVEDSPIDYYWGCGKERNGENKLGQILMEVRAQLREA